MIAPVRKESQSIDQKHHDRFHEMLPLIRHRARLAFRRMRPEIKDELVQETIANAFCRFSRLVRTGKAALAFATPLANYAIRQVIAGRHVGNKQNCQDVFSVVAQRQQGFTLRTLPSESSNSSVWSEILADNTVTAVPDQVAFRLDFAAWLRIQNRRKRELAKFLAAGNSATEAAQQFGVSGARVCQIRRELQASWEAFQGEES